MNELVSLLDPRERRTVKTAAVIAGLVCAVVLVFAVRAQSGAGRAMERFRQADLLWKEALRSRDAAEAEFGRWTRAAADVGELGSTWFYDANRNFQELRADLERIFDEAGVVVSEIVFGDLELVKGRLRRTTAEFRINVSYPMVRRLLEIVENHPRALHLERVEFANAGNAFPGGGLEARIALSGYSLHAK